MQIYTPRSIVTVVFDMIDPSNSEAIVPTSATWSLFDDEGNELRSFVPLTVSGDEQELGVQIDSADNLNEGARTVALNVTSNDGNFTLTQSYVLQGYRPLSVPTESAMTEATATLIRSGIASSGFDEWDYAGEITRRAALLEAWSRIKELPLHPWRLGEQIAPELVSFNGRKVRLDEFDKDQFQALPDHFKNALKRAQITEAAALLESDGAFERRRDGLISKTVGESSEMFTSQSPAMKSIHPATNRILSPYIKQTISIGRV